MQRLSRGDITQPDWAIAEYEVELETQIGIGSFSTVYKGTWRKRTVAIKYLRWETTPRDQFKKEVSEVTQLGMQHELLIDFNAPT